MPTTRPRSSTGGPAAALLALASALLLGACAPDVAVRPLTPTQIDQAREGRHALVLLRIETVIDGKPAPPTGAADSNRSVRIYAARMDAGDTPARVVPAALSETSAAAGWRYLLLPPGRHFVLLLPPGVEQNPPAVAYHAPSGKFGRLTQYRLEQGRGGFWVPELMAYVFPDAAPRDFAALTGYWLDVREDTPVVYAGSLRVTCTNGRGLGGLMDNCSDFALLDESAEAARVAAATPALAPPTFSPLVPYGRPRVVSHPAELGNLAVRMQRWRPLDASYPGAQLAGWGVIHGSQRPVMIFNLLAVAAHALGQATAAQESEKLAQDAAPCMAALSRGLEHFDGEAQFASAMRTALPATNQTDGARLIAEPYALRLRESTNPGQLALELGLHVRLERVSLPGVAYESRIVHAEPFPRDNPLNRSTRLYERLTQEHPAAHPIARWCGPDGPALLEAELQRGLAAIAAQVARDLR